MMLWKREEEGERVMMLVRKHWGQYQTDEEEEAEG